MCNVMHNAIGKILLGKGSFSGRRMIPCQGREGNVSLQDKAFLREAFQSKKRGNLGNGPNRGGWGRRQKIKTVPTFSWEKFKIRGVFSTLDQDQSFPAL